MELVERIFRPDPDTLPWWYKFSVLPARFLVALWDQISHDKIIIRASGLAYASLLAAVPLVAVLFALFSAFAAFDNLKTKVEDLLFSQFLPAYQDEIVAYINQFTSNTSRLGFLGFVFLIVAAIMLLDGIESNVNDIWHVSSRRTIVNKINAYTSVLVFGTVLLGISIVLTSTIKAKVFTGRLVDLSTLAKIGNWIFPLLLTLLAFLLMYLIIPFTRVRLSSAAFGALVAGALWEVGKHAFANSIGQSVQYSTIYGTLAVLPIFLIWLYITWVIVLLGVEITFTHQNFASLVRQRCAIDRCGRDHVALAFKVYASIAARFVTGKEPPTATELADRYLAPHRAIEEHLERLISSGLTRRATTDSGDEGYVPSTSLDRITVSDLMHAVFGDAEPAEEPGDALDSSVEALVSRFQAAGHQAVGATTLREVVDSLPEAAEAGEEDPAASPAQ